MLLTISSLKFAFDFYDDTILQNEVWCVGMIRGGFHVLNTGLFVSDWFVSRYVKCYFVFQSASVSCSGFTEGWN